MIERKTPRLLRRLVKMAKKPSIALSHEADVGVKWKVKRVWRQPGDDLGMLGRSIVVQDHMNDLAG